MQIQRITRVPHCANVVWPDLVQSKATAQAIERNHCRQRHWFGRFKRKSIIVSKSQEYGEPHHGPVREVLGQWESE
jgi:hypothetical protein